MEPRIVPWWHMASRSQRGYSRYRVYCHSYTARRWRYRHRDNAKRSAYAGAVIGACYACNSAKSMGTATDQRRQPCRIIVGRKADICTTLKLKEAKQMAKSTKAGAAAGTQVAKRQMERLASAAARAGAQAGRRAGGNAQAGAAAGVAAAKRVARQPKQK